MRKISLLLSLLLVLGVSAVYAEGCPSDLLRNVAHFKQSTIRIQGEKIIYFDPYRIAKEPHDADLVFLTHTHGDHYSVIDISVIMKATTIFVTTADGVAKLKEMGISNIVTVVPNQDYEVAGVKFHTVPAYNLNKNYHPRSSNWVGYVAQINQVAYYVAGDTDLIPEMKDIKADVAFLPVGGRYTMTAEEAAQAANLIKPKVAVPIHFADVVGTVDDAKKFLSLLDPPIQGVILKKIW